MSTTARTASIILPLILGTTLAAGTSAQQQVGECGDGFPRKVRFVLDLGGRREIRVESLRPAAMPPGRDASSLADVDGAAAPDYVTFPARELPGIVDSDLDGDGLLDAVGVDYSGILVSLGHGNGTCGPATVSGDAFFPQILLLGDVTGDGEPDVVVLDQANWEAPLTLDVHPGHGASFGDAISTAMPQIQSFADVALADLDDDGLADWVCNEWNDIESYTTELDVGLAAGNGTFRFTTPSPLESKGYPSGFAIGDFDGDGTLDVATAVDFLSDPAQVHSFAGVGDGTLSPSPVVTTLAPSIFPSLTARDEDADGVTDLLSVGVVFDGQGPADRLVVLHGAGDGSFAEAANIAVPGAGEAFWGDVNGDGLDDLVDVIGAEVLEGGVPTGLATLLADGAGGFGKPLVVGWPGQFLAPSGLRDIDGDDTLDVVLADCFAHGRGDGTFEGSTTASIPYTSGFPSGPVRLAAADMNLDGALDVVATRKKQAKGLVVFLGHGDASFDVYQQNKPASTELELGDLDGDGAPDVVATGGGSAVGTRSLLNDGTGVALSAPTLVLAFSADGIDLGDMDGDGALDLLATRAVTGAPDALLLRGDGHGGFLPAQTLAVGGVSKLIQGLDLDADGVLDVATTSTSPSTLVTLTGVGGGVFGAPQPVPLPITPETMTFADFDRDGNVDAAVAFEDPYGHSLHVLFAQAPGQFGPSVELPWIWNVEALGAADVDRDGWPDILAVSSAYELLTFRGAAAPAFTNVETTLLDGAIDSMVLGDFTGDGRIDVAVGSDFLMLVRGIPNVLPDFPNLGYQHAASFGTPHLLTTGAPIPDQQVSFTATNVPAPALGFLFLGLDFAPTLFQGGTLVPSPDVVVPMRPQLPLVGRWPKLPAGTAVYAQAWFAAGGEVAGSNAIMGVTQ